MARRKSPNPIRNRGSRLPQWLLIICTGLVGGMFLGEAAIENRPVMMSGGGAPYADLSANPDAAALTTMPHDTYGGGPDSYGAAARLGAHRETRMDDAFRELGAVDADRRPATESVSDYQYGGRFLGSPQEVKEATATIDAPLQDEVALPVTANPLP